MAKGNVGSNGRGTVKLGFIALTDCAPLAVASALGYFAAEGLRVELSREAGWATIREKLLYGELDGAHAVAGLAIALRLGLDCAPADVCTAFFLNANGNAITLSRRLWNAGVHATGDLRAAIRANQPRKFVFGVVSLHSSHHFLMRLWLQQAGVDPDHDVRLAVIPPALVADALEEGLIDGYCVGEPWNSAAILGGFGWCVATSHDLAPGHPEKALLMRGEFAEDRAAEHAALQRALIRAGRWCDEAANRPDLAALLSGPEYLDTTVETLRHSLVGPFATGTGKSLPAASLHRFSGGALHLPDSAKRDWLAAQFTAHRLWKGTPPARQRAVLQAAFRPDLHAEPACPPAPPSLLLAA